MDEEVATSFWISFFVEAGIPPAAAANYAIIFTENRIQKGMLLDLNKEYLKDMGVNVLGDIIAILKHSKLYHEKAAREKVLAKDKQLSVLKATQHLNEILLSEEPVKSTPTSAKDSGPTVKASSGPSPPKKLKVTKTESFQAAEDPEWVEQVEELKRKVIPPSAKILAKASAPATPAAKPAAKKSSVFDRLGESNVTSTTPEIPEPSSASTIKTSASVFNRLGGLQISQKTVPTGSKNESSAVARLVAKTAAAAAAETTVNKVAVPSKSPSISVTKMRMDIESESGKQSARQRLGIDSTMKAKVSTAKLQTKTPGRTTIASRIDRGKSGTVKSNPSANSSSRATAGVKQRLGSAATLKNSTGSTSSNVFKRLGTTRK